MNTLVFDIETSNFFTDVGRYNFGALDISAVGLYSYAEDKYACFAGEDIKEGLRLLGEGDTLVGFGISRYDIPVLNHHYSKLLSGGLNFFHKNRVDLLDEIELVTGRRVSLNRLAQANLGQGKLAHDGSEAIDLYKAGKIEELKAYCLKDVELTKLLYDMYRDQKCFLIPNKETGEMERVQFSGRAGMLVS